MTSDDRANDEGSTLKLVSILKGGLDTQGSGSIKFIRTGNKLDNKAMRLLLARLSEKGYDSDKLLNTYLLLDESVEKGILTEEAINNFNPKDIEEKIE